MPCNDYRLNLFRDSSSYFDEAFLWAFADPLDNLLIEGLFELFEDLCCSREKFYCLIS